MSNYVQRFLLEDLDIRGAIVHLDSVWQEMLFGRSYPQPVTQLLGEMSAITLLLGENLKQTGRLIIQLTGSDPISLLLMDCTESLHLRGMAKCEQTIKVTISSRFTWPWPLNPYTRYAINAGIISKHRTT
ncbi:Hsp33 family molecular chaperone HslO [Nitrosomonas ureae]|uniref:Hsp33 protein n=1 Tax=Nitrosomonas ureae TaxID=44577 RepID=A0A2T5HYL0_9PROT|nr:Hsp33 family molecular chaperone HslO [Nitrosomonas ureae]PTQ76681.1 Hsp33 protein [Nitrosomonas ureae]